MTKFIRVIVLIALWKAVEAFQPAILCYRKSLRTRLLEADEDITTGGTTGESFESSQREQKDLAKMKEMASHNIGNSAERGAFTTEDVTTGDYVKETGATPRDEIEPNNLMQNDKIPPEAEENLVSDDSMAEETPRIGEDESEKEQVAQEEDGNEVKFLQQENGRFNAMEESGLMFAVKYADDNRDSSQEATAQAPGSTREVESPQTKASTASTQPSSKTSFSLQETVKSFDPRGEIVKFGENELVKALWKASNDIARDLFAAVRRQSAALLTASLPDDERMELLERTLGRKVVQATLGGGEARQEQTRTLSVQESQVAAAVREAKRKSKEEWELEKKSISEQAEQATQDRVQTELAIQKQRMQQERQKLLDEAEALKQEISQEKEAKEALEVSLRKERQQVARQVDSTEASRKEANDELEKLQASLRTKEDQAQLDQEKLQDISKKLEEATQQLQARDGDSPKVHGGHYNPSDYRSLTDAEKEEVRLLREQQGLAAAPKHEDNEPVTDHNPILGPVVLDLGYKRIHLMSGGTLGTIPIWEKQRIYRHDRAKAMMTDKWKSMSLGLPGIICLHEDADGKLSIIDGQHRVGMIMLLREKQRKLLEESSTSEGDESIDTSDFIDFDQILVEVYPQRDTDDKRNQAQDLFLEINKSEPIKLVDMPGIAKAKDRKIITDAVEMLNDLYPDMFSPSQRCRSPNVNIDNLRDQLFAGAVIKRQNLTTAKKLLEWMLKQNTLLTDKYGFDDGSSQTLNTRALKKARKHDFYLGIDSTWLYN